MLKKESRGEYKLAWEESNEEQEGKKPKGSNGSYESFTGNIVQHRIEFNLDGTMEALDGEYLEINSVPILFNARYGLIPKRIYIRDCYRDLYNIATAKMLMHHDHYPVALFTGVPGIGKSLFLVYFIFRFLDDPRFSDKRFAVEFQVGIYHYFVPTNVPGAFEYFVTNSTSFPFFEIPIFSDIESPSEPQNRGKYLFIFSSPNPMRYKEKMKNFPKFRYTLPTWSHSELLYLESDDSLWLEQFELLGGVPRSLFEGIEPLSMIDVEESVNRTLIEKGGVIADYFFKNGFGNIDSENNYLLVHINPPKNHDGEWMYDKLVHYSFASDEVFRRIVNMYHTRLLQMPMNLLNFGIASEAYGGATAGNLFEKICLWMKPIAGRQISADSMQTGLVRTINLPSISLLDYHWRRNAREDPTKRLQPNVLYQPKISNLESGDAFCVLPLDQGGLQLIILQITISERHPIKVGGLCDIIAAFPQEVQEQVCAKLLVFVTPIDGKLASAQPFCSRQNKVIDSDKLPPSAHGFEQFVYRHSI